MATYQFGAFTEAEILAQGTAGSNLGRGDSFTMPTATSTVFDVYDNDPYLSGDRRDNATDRSGQTATVTENGTVTSSGEQIYAEVYYWVRDQAGNWYIMIEVEIENTSGDYFSFFGDVPPAGSDLTIYCSRNVCGNWVDYNCLQDPEQVIPPMAADDALTILENETGTLNVLDNDFDMDGTTINVTAVEGGDVGQPFVVESAEGWDAMVTLNADGSLIVEPGPEFAQMGQYETTTLTFTYTITDADGLTSTATVTVNVNGLGGDAAVDDAITVMESEGFGDTDLNVLDNDVDGDASGTIDIAAVNGDAANIGQVVMGSNGGLAVINADGTMDFSANGDFEALNDGESATTTFTYEVETGGGTLAASMVIPISGPNGLEAEITVIEVGGDLQFTVEVLSNGGHIGDIRALYFDFANEGLLDGLSVSGAHVTDSRFLANSVNELGNGTNVRGELNHLGLFDAGVEIGTQGMSGDDIQLTTFTISHSSQALDLGLLSDQDFGLRLTSVGAENGNRCDSLKLGGKADGVIEEISVATVTVTVLGEDEITLVANNDAVTVQEDEGAGDVEGNALTNDTLNDGAYTGDVTDVNGDAANVGQWVTGSNGGQMLVNADGTFDFDAAGAFDYLKTGETAQTTFTYQICVNDGDTTTSHEVMDFNGFAAGDILGALPGVTISSANPSKPPMIFDTANPTGGDTDLASSTAGMVLILSEDGDTNDPDDNASGGTLIFDFDTPVHMDGMTFLDTEEAGEARFYDASGALIATIATPAMADGEAQSVTFNITGVARMEIELCGSGAIDDLSFYSEVPADPVYDTATITVTVEGRTDYVAVADTMTVLASEAFGDADTLDTGAATVLANDTEDGAAYTGAVLEVNTDVANVAAQVTGTNGGLLIINADGTLDFSANGEFGDLLAGQSRDTQFTYTIEDGKTASVTVTVEGETVRMAFDDAMTVYESEAAGDADLLDTGAASVLANDTENGGAYGGVVGAVNGALGNVNSFVAGTGGGLLQIMADGSLDFDANDEFDYLAEGETTQTTFTYELISGEEATVTVTVVGEAEHIANDDSLTVMESEGAGDTETLDGGALTILANDTTDGGTYTGLVEDVNGDAANIGVTVVGSTGGMATIYADGTIDFDANGDFDYLTAGETAQTTFTYGIDGGDTATVTVNVQGEDDAPTGQVINLALMLNSTATMFEQAQTAVFGFPPYQDWDGNGLGNQVMDLAYLMLSDFMSDAFDVAAAANVTLNVALITFDETVGGEGAQYVTVNNAANFDAQLDAKIAGDNSGDYGQGFTNADTWFDTVAGTGDTNAMFFLANGFSTDPWLTEFNAMKTDHNVVVDSYLPDAVFSGAAYAELNTMDKDGVTDSIFFDDPALAATYSLTAGQDALSLDPLIL